MAMKHDENERQHNQPSFHFRPALLLTWHDMYKTQCFVIKRNWVSYISPRFHLNLIAF